MRQKSPWHRVLRAERKSTVENKMRERKAIIALYKDEFAGFCYIET